ncbi:MAG: hypothetical protein LBC20_04350 [Planctomycetaceae bacterium]|nr:hypothetical protein [Planctomycetaceae bacterium]
MQPENSRRSFIFVPDFLFPVYSFFWRDALHYATTSAKLFKHQDYNNLIKEIQKKGVPMPTSLLDELVAEGITKGRTEGITKGRTEGRTEFGRNAVLSLLHKRFVKIPKKIETAVRRMNDPIALESLVIDAATCQTLREFSDALR